MTTCALHFLHNRDNAQPSHGYLPKPSSEYFHNELEPKDFSLKIKLLKNQEAKGTKGSDHWKLKDSFGENLCSVCESGTNSYEIDPIETHICETEYSQKFF